jgi:hypothetical protein
MKRSTLCSLAGVLISYPVSYYFQSEVVQHKLTLGQYISHFSEVIQNKELQTPVIVSLAICSLLGGIVGRVLDKQDAGGKRDKTDGTPPPSQ